MEDITQKETELLSNIQDAVYEYFKQATDQYNLNDLEDRATSTMYSVTKAIQDTRGW